MKDPYASIAAQNADLQTRLADVLELRGADAVQREMMNAYLAELDLPTGTVALEVGCGTGVVTRAIAQLSSVEVAIGIDPSPVFVERAQELSEGRVSFRVGDGQALDFGDGEFDLVVLHTTLCHVPDPARALAEAVRVLKPGGVLAIFDGDYVTATVATSPNDPLQNAVDVAIANFVAHPWMARRLPRELAALGMQVQSFRSHGYTTVRDASYMLSIVQRGLDLMVGQGAVGGDAAAALGAEARRRSECGEFFGHISYVSAIARRPRRDVETLGA